MKRPGGAEGDGRTTVKNLREMRGSWGKSVSRV